MFKCKRRKLVLLALVVTLVVLSLVTQAGAVETRSGDMVTVPEGKIQGPLFAAGNNVVINADVDGDVFAAGETITINGKINGDLLAAANTIRINGNVSGDARCAAAVVDIKGELGQSLTAAARDVTQFEGSRVGRDVLVFGSEVSLSGMAGRQVLGSGETIRLNGPVGSDVRLWSVGELRLGPAANIKGNLTYGSKTQAFVAPEAKIAGAVNWEEIQPKVKETVRHEGFNWLAQLASFAAGVLVWGVLALLFPGVWGNLSQTVRQSTWPALGWGVLFLLVAPLASLLLLITVIGIPLSLTLIATYTLLIYAGKIIIGDAIGRLLARRFGWERRLYEIFPFMIGFAGLILLTKIPVVGFFINVVVASVALGAVFLTFYNWRQRPPVPPVTE